MTDGWAGGPTQTLVGVELSMGCCFLGDLELLVVLGFCEKLGRGDKNSVQQSSNRNLSS